MRARRQFTARSNSNAEDAHEVANMNMHMAGHAWNGAQIKLRFKESLGTYVGDFASEGLQIWSSVDTSAATVYKFVFRLMIA
tara:strand:- start:6862 stop:7107 length:246 start_codon:yes stop_codon:yes gene_type:complete